MKVEISRQEAIELWKKTGRLKYRILAEMVKDVEGDLREFLLAREYDIANDIENFGLLKDVFEVVIGRKARRECSLEELDVSKYPTMKN